MYRASQCYLCICIRVDCDGANIQLLQSLNYTTSYLSTIGDEDLFNVARLLADSEILSDTNLLYFAGLHSVVRVHINARQ